MIIVAGLTWRRMNWGCSELVAGTTVRLTSQLGYRAFRLLFFQAILLYLHYRSTCIEVYIFHPSGDFYSIYASSGCADLFERI